MKALVERLSPELSERYVQYLKTFLVDLWSEPDSIEFRAGYVLRRDRELRSVTVKVDAASGQTDAERELPVIAAFDEIEQKIDIAIADNKADAN